ncbi:MAG: rhombosortase, partial [Gammaproteobacteria bacterium]
PRPDSFMSFTRWINVNGLSVYLLAIACLLWGPWSDLALQFFALDRAGLEQGQFWRLWSGPLVHLSWAHVIFNMLGLVVLQQMFGEELGLRNWLIAFTILAPVIGVVWLMSPVIAWLPSNSYAFVVGFSALLHGLFAYAACLALHRDRWLATAVLLVIGLKIIWEQIAGPSAFTSDLIDMPIAADTHLYGYAGGLVLGALMLRFRPQSAYA